MNDLVLKCVEYITEGAAVFSAVLENRPHSYMPKYGFRKLTLGTSFSKLMVYS